MATKTWTGTGTWSTSNGANWSGGTAPVANDDIVFDGTSGTGVCTADSSINGMTFGTLTCGAYGGTVDLSAVAGLTLTRFNLSGTGARTITLGAITLTLTGNNANIWDCGTATNLVPSFASASFIITGPGASSGNQTFAGGGQTYGNLTVNSRIALTLVLMSGVNAFSSMTLNGPLQFIFPQTATTTIGTLTINGTSAGPVSLVQASRIVSTLSISGSATISWAAIQAITVSGAASPITANNSFDMKGNTNITINPPLISGGRAGVIG